MNTILLFLYLACLFQIAVQDFQSREIYAVLFPIAGAVSAFLFYRSAPLLEVFVLGIALNLSLILLITGLLWVVYTFILHKPFINVQLGWGDVLLWGVMALAYPSLTFVVLWSSSILFSWLISLVLYPKKNDPIPLAGITSGFLGVFHLIAWSMSPYFLYRY